jgi:hypothetical protein
MGAYSNPQGFIDTQSGQHWRDLATNLTNISVNSINAKKAKDKEAADEIKKNKEKFAKDQMAVDQWTIEQKSRIHAVSQKGGTVEWDSTYDKWIQRAADIRLDQLTGNTDPALRKELMAIQTSVEDYANGIANLAGLNETYTKKRGLYGKEEGISASNDSNILRTLDLLSGKLPSKSKSTDMKYNPGTGTMEQMMYVTDNDGKQYPLSITDINKMASNPNGFGGLTLIPAVTKSIDVLNVALMNNAKGTTKNANGETEVNARYADSFIDTNFTGEINGIKYTKGVGTIERQVGAERTGKKDVATNWEQIKVYALDVNKIIGNEQVYRTKTMAEADALLVDPSEAKAAWVESIKPQLVGMSKDEFLPEGQRDKIKDLLNKLEGADDFKTPFTVDQKENVKEGYLLLSKGLLTKQNRVQEGEKTISVRKGDTSKTSSNNSGGDNKDDSLIFANTPEYVTSEIAKLTASAVGTYSLMYLNIRGETNEYRVERIQSTKGKPGFKIYKGENGGSGVEEYGRDIEKAALGAIRSQTKAQQASLEYYNKTKK